MKAHQYTLVAASEVHQFFRGYRAHPPTGWWFRGQANSSWELLPKAGRPQYSLPDGRSLGRFRRWSRQALAYLPDLPSNDWERLAVAQHYGLATCLLDWTYNPLVALYFACYELPSLDGTVFCYDPKVYLDEMVVPLDSAECRGAGFIPRAISPRILNQKSVFTVHLPATQTIQVEPHYAWKDHSTLAKLVIPAKLKPELIEMLNDYGINSVTLFPDLEGLSRHVNWETETIARTPKATGD